MKRMVCLPGAFSSPGSASKIFNLMERLLLLGVALSINIVRDLDEAKHFTTTQPIPGDLVKFSDSECTILINLET